MPRVKIELPATWIFSTELPVRITDINYGQHVGNDTMLALLQEARVRWLRSLGYPSELIVAPVGLILVDLAVRMKSEAAYGDVLRVQLVPVEWTKLGFEVVYLMTKAGSDEEVARATTGFVFFDYEKRKLAPIPADFRAKAGGQAVAAD